MKVMNDGLSKKASKIKLLILDCDGVLTDGRLYFSESGEVMKAFDVKDGQGITNWHNSGFKTCIITGRDGSIVEARARELGIYGVIAGPTPKDISIRELQNEIGISCDEIAFVGDDIGDLSAFKVVGLKIAVADAISEVRAAADYITTAKGGRGAVREAIDLLIASRKTD